MYGIGYKAVQLLLGSTYLIKRGELPPLELGTSPARRAQHVETTPGTAPGTAPEARVAKEPSKHCMGVSGADEAMRSNAEWIEAGSKRVSVLFFSRMGGKHHVSR